MHLFLILPTLSTLQEGAKLGILGITPFEYNVFGFYSFTINRCANQINIFRDWCSSRRFQLNPNKTELIWFSFRAKLVKLRQLDVISLNLSSVTVESVDSVRDLGVILDRELSMRFHISNISSTYFFHLRRLRKLRPLIDTASA